MRQRHRLSEPARAQAYKHYMRCAWAGVYAVHAYALFWLVSFLKQKDFTKPSDFWWPSIPYFATFLRIAYLALNKSPGDENSECAVDVVFPGTTMILMLVSVCQIESCLAHANPTNPTNSSNPTLYNEVEGKCGDIPHAHVENFFVLVISALYYGYARNNFAPTHYVAAVAAVPVAVVGPEPAVAVVRPEPAVAVPVAVVGPEPAVAVPVSTAISGSGPGSVAVPFAGSAMAVPVSTAISGAGSMPAAVPVPEAMAVWRAQGAGSPPNAEANGGLSGLRDPLLGDKGPGLG